MIDDKSCGELVIAIVLQVPHYPGPFLIKQVGIIIITPFYQASQSVFIYKPCQLLVGDGVKDIPDRIGCRCFYYIINNRLFLFMNN